MGTRSSLAFVVTSMTLLAAHAASPATGAVAGRPASAGSAASDTIGTPLAAPSKPLVDACPAQLTVSRTVVEPIAGWTPLDMQVSHPFVRVAFYSGPPPEASLLVPTAEYHGQAGLHDRWDLPRRDGGYWMTCAYGNTSATLTRKLADDVDFCLADYDGRFLTLVVKHWSCGVKRTLAPATRERPAGRPVKPGSRTTGRRGG